MNRNQAKKFYPIMQAFAEGKTIERRTKSWKLNKGWQYSTTWKAKILMNIVLNLNQNIVLSKMQKSAGMKCKNINPLDILN